MINYKNILMTAAIIVALSTTVFAMREECTEEFINNAMRVGRVVEMSYCDKCENTFPTVWSFEGATVRSQSHSCKFKNNLYEKDLYKKELKKLEIKTCLNEIKKENYSFLFLNYQEQCELDFKERLIMQVHLAQHTIEPTEHRLSDMLIEHDYDILGRLAYILSPKSFPKVDPNFLNCIEKITPKLEEDKIQSYKDYKLLLSNFSSFTKFFRIKEYEEIQKKVSEPFNLIHFSNDVFLSIFSWLPNDDYMQIAQVSRKLYNLARNPSIALRHLESLAQNPVLVGIRIKDIEENFKELPTRSFFKKSENSIVENFEKEFEQDVKKLWTIVKFHYEILRKKNDFLGRKILLLDDHEDHSYINF